MVWEYILHTGTYRTLWDLAGCSKRRVAAPRGMERNGKGQQSKRHMSLIVEFRTGARAFCNGVAGLR